MTSNAKLSKDRLQKLKKVINLYSLTCAKPMLTNIVRQKYKLSLNRCIYMYSRVSNKSTGTLKRTHPKIPAVPNFLCGTIEGNSQFWVVVLLFHSP